MCDSSLNKAMKSTSTKDLEQAIMDSTLPKNEREWWAKQRIEDLQAALAAMTQERDEARKSNATTFEAVVVVENLQRQLVATQARVTELEKALMASDAKRIYEDTVPQ